VKEVLRTNDPVRISFAESLLADSEIESFKLDDSMSDLYGGGLPFIKKRLMVADDDELRARRVLEQMPSENA
jgi:hypothetical protein